MTLYTLLNQDQRRARSPLMCRCRSPPLSTIASAGVVGTERVQQTTRNSDIAKLGLQN